METDTLDRILRVIDERFVRLRRDLLSVIPKLPGGGAGECGCLLDHGCCSDKGCCNDKGCCKQNAPDRDWEEVVDLAERLHVPVEVLLARVRALDPKLLGVKT